MVRGMAAGGGLSNRSSRSSFMSDTSSDKYEDALNDSGDPSEWYLPVALHDKRHRERILGSGKQPSTWRIKERMKTVSVALVLCLNVGVDPPDVLKIQPCAREECWTDPLSMGPRKALENIGAQLQKQYERWQPRARSKLSLDPTLDEVKKLCQSLRRNAKEERVLFHYNGHGVPKPTENGEIWVFNKTYTQYIPLSLYTLQSWMGTPSIYVFDCSNAGLILEKFSYFQQERESKMDTSTNSSTGSINNESSKQCILLGACSPTELLPQDPNLPADLFTACLTTPIKMALRWYVLQNSGNLVKGVTKELVDEIPGELNDRRTMLGELNWIFTAITDTIAWNVLPRDTFQKLFRQDLLCASLFRNFLLAERIMRTYNCTPVSNQNLPSTYQHPMWQAWDYTLDACLSQLPAVLKSEAEYQYSTFFADQLTAFQVWLEYGSDNRSPPEQLPIVLQVLLSQVHRLRALDLLSKFLDHGPKAVSLALSVGIFPYVLRLLQSSARELRILLVFIWAKILSVDLSCQVDLVKDGGHKYFLSVLDDRDVPSEYRTMAAFVLTMIVNEYPNGQATVHQGKAIFICLLHLEDRHDYRLRQWCALCLGQIWQNYPAAKWNGVRDNAHEKLYRLLEDDYPEVRSAAIFALGTFINQSEGRTDHANNIDHSIGMKLCSMVNDPSPMIREELLAAIAGFISVSESQFVAIAYQLLEEESILAEEARMHSPKPSSAIKSTPSSPFGSGTIVSNSSASAFGSSDSLDGSGAHYSSSAGSSAMRRVASGSTVLGITNVYNLMWNTVLQLTTDPFPAVSQSACIIVNILKTKATNYKPRPITGIATGKQSISAASSPTGRMMREGTPTGYLQNQSSKVFSPSTSHEKHDSFPNRQNSNLGTTGSPTSPTALNSPPIPHTPERMVNTEFFTWSCKMFEESVINEFWKHDITNNDVQLQQERKLLYEHNVKVKESALSEQLKASYTPLDSEIFMNNMSSLPAILKFHPYDVRLAIADSEFVSIWDWEASVKLNQFHNHTSRSCKISAMEYLNAHDKDKSLLAVATDDGSLRIWKDFSSRSQDLGLVTAWNAMPESPLPKSGFGTTGIIMEWQQCTSSLYFSGAHKFIRLFDVNKEIKVMDMPTGIDACVTSLCSDSVTRHRVVAACTDGSIRVFDRRLPAAESRVCTFQHGSWVINCQIQTAGEGSLISAGHTGEIKFWDMRKLDCVGSFSVGSRIRYMVLHRQAKLIACGLPEQMINIYNTSGDTTSQIKYHDGFMGQRLGKVNCLSFHPHLVRLAAGYMNGVVSVYTMSDKSK